MSAPNSPNGLVVIRPATPDDLEAVLRVRQAVELAEDGTTVTTADHLAAEWAALGPGLARDAWVATTAEGHVLACAQLIHEQGSYLPRLWVPPAARGQGLEAALLTCAEQQATAIAREEGAQQVHLFAQATSAHPEAQRAIAEAGYTMTSTFEQMVCRLDAPPAPLPDLASIAIRPLIVGQEETIYAADEEAFRDARGHDRRTFEQWCRRLNRHGEQFAPWMWRVAWDGDAVAGAALGEVVGDDGWIHHLGVRRPWRRHGLGAALVLAAFSAFYAHGVRSIKLNVDDASPTNAHLLYRRLGFRVARTYANYEKVVPLA